MKNERAPALRSVVLAGALAAGLAVAHQAVAAPLAIETSGTILSGMDTSGVFGAAGADLTSDSYTLRILFDDLGAPSTTAGLSQASASSSGLVTATVGGVTFDAPITTSFGGFATETATELYGFNVGQDGGGNAISATNDFTTAANAFPVDLTQSIAYAAQPGDAGLSVGAVQFSLSGPGGTVSFLGTPSFVSLAVPEPGSLILAASGLAAFVLIRCRRA